MRCRACRRPLTNPASIKHGLGPDCLRRAVKAGTAPLEALTELAEWKRSKKRDPKPAKQSTGDGMTLDIFESHRTDALANLQRAVADCESLGIRINLTVENP